MFRTILAVASLLIATVLCAQATELVIQLPQKIAPEKTIIICGEYGDGLSLSTIKTSPGVYEYHKELWDLAKSIKLLMYCPGYKIVTKEVTVGDLTTIAPNFEPVPMSSLKIRLVDTKNHPVVGEKINLIDELSHGPYFKLMEGPPTDATMASGVTDSKGEVTLQVPVLEDDPFYEECKNKFFVLDTLLSGEAKSDPWRYEYNPQTIASQYNYLDVVQITKIYMGKLTVKLSKSFMEQIGIADSVGKLNGPTLNYQKTGTAGGAGQSLEADGTVSLTVPAGTYKLYIEVHDNEYHILKTIPIEDGVVVGEKADVVIEK